MAERALALVSDGMSLGLGTGRAATAFLNKLGERVAREGLRVRGVATSTVTALRAERLGIPIVTLAEIEFLDLAVDGADEVDPHLNLIKGLGGALAREKVVASSARHFCVVVGREKLVSRLGSHGVLPIEVISFALPSVIRRLRALGIESSPRTTPQGLYLSDNGNPIVDGKVAPMEDPSRLEKEISAIPGVVETGLFLGMAHRVLVGDDHEVVELSRSTASGPPA